MSTPKARGELLEALRLSRGLTQAQVASATGISQAVLSKLESGDADANEEKWDQLADFLGVPATAFSHIVGSVAPARIFHRKRKMTPQTAVRKVAAELTLVRLRVEYLLGARRTSLRRHDLEDGFSTPQEVAQLVRNELGIGTEPIQNLVGLLESAGAVVLRWPLEAIQVDAIASWQDDTVPVVLIGEHVPPDRQRFTVAHELGHAVMHDGDASESQEREADAFAGEFLLPAERLVAEWPSSPSLEDLLPVKRKWGVSLPALIRRAYDADILSEDEYRRWNILLSTTGMHRREPQPTEREDPAALSESIREALAAGSTIDQLASHAYMYPREFEFTFLQETT
jgi:Zn-dependent peptidase ImmA (M78 family)/transcriptional regulator with XRE-family HTH domain